MKAFRLVEFGQPFQRMEIPIREPGPGEVLVKVEASGICYSDVPVAFGIRPTTLPVTLGHECAGIAVQTGAGVEDITAGERVSIFYLLACEECETCRRGFPNACPNRRSIGLHQDGGFAEFLTLPAKNVITLPENVPFEVGAIAGCAISTAFHAIRVTQVEAGEHVAVVGLGGVGLHVAQLAKIRGASLVIGIDKNPLKRALAKSLGVDVFVQAEEDPLAQVLRLTGGSGVHAAFECVGIPSTYEIVFHMVRPGGRVGLLGVCADEIQLRPFPLLMKEIRIFFAVNHTFEEQHRVIEMLSESSLNVSGSITHRFPLSRLQEGFDLLRAGQGEIGKVVVLNTTE